MPNVRRTGRRGLFTTAATVFTVTGLTLLAMAFVPGRQPPPEAPAAARAHSEATAPVPLGQAVALPASEPVRITAKRHGLDAPVKAVGIGKDGSIALPEEAGHAGWYTGSPTPGERGNAVLAGHVDSDTGPAAFYGLGALREGDRITVHRRDGRNPVFIVTALSVHPNNAFPSQKVYGPAPQPQLTLVTCADWDTDDQTYRANLVITAHLADKPHTASH
ncbi:class F sortase [Streptomyces sp. DH24]|uniref:class F sortase n=1 Tax=Streptomyces sp. DH24 TaxID=3040123 RepID=UPI00244176E3|nr:class F sortase [Streptomyces sp. DH24]MDG9717237.1 sortase [Streptomyces sp. DH24]